MMVLSREGLFSSYELRPSTSKMERRRACRIMRLDCESLKESTKGSLDFADSVSCSKKTVPLRPPCLSWFLFISTSFLKVELWWKVILFLILSEAVGLDTLISVEESSELPWSNNSSRGSFRDILCRSSPAYLFVHFHSLPLSLI